MKVIDKDKAPSIHSGWEIGVAVVNLSGRYGSSKGTLMASLLPTFLLREDADGRETIHPKSRDFLYYENSRGIRQT